MIDYKIGREECISLIKKARLPIPVKSGCYMCQFNNMQRWAEIYEKYPDLYRYAVKIEEEYNKHFGKQHQSQTKVLIRISWNNHCC